MGGEFSWWLSLCLIFRDCIDFVYYGILYLNFFLVIFVFVLNLFIVRLGFKGVIYTEIYLNFLGLYPT